MYTFDNGPYTVTISINSNAQMTGSDTDGCVLNGTVSVPKSNHNVLLVAIRSSSNYAIATPFSR